MKNLSFAEFLVEKKYLAEDILVQSLIETINKLPSLVEFVHRKKLLTSEQIFKVLILQSHEKTDFQSACRKAGFWREEIYSQFEGDLGDLQASLFSTLVKENKLSSQELIRALDAYLASVEQPAATPTVSLPPADVAPAKSAGLETGTQTFVEQFSEAEKKTLSEIQWRDPQSVHEGLSVAHRLVGAARFASLERTVSALEIIEMAIRGLSQNLPEETIQSYSKHFSQTIEAVWSLRNHIQRTGEDKEFSKAFPDYDNQIDVFLERISELPVELVAKEAS